MNLTNRLKSAVTAIVIIGSAVSVIALAKLPGESLLDIDDLGMDLTTRSGVLAFYHRLQDAAMLSCDPSGDSRVLPYFNRPESGDCYSDTLSAALLSYNHRLLTDVHEQLRRDPVIVDDNF